MGYTFWANIAETPWWFALFLAYLIYFGYLSTKPRIISANSLILWPSALVTLSTASLYYFVTISLFAIAVWVAALFLGIVLGWLRFRTLKVSALADGIRLRIPGNFGIVIILTLTLLLKYYFAFPLILTPEYIVQPHILTALVCLYGYFTGYMMGRFFYARRCLKHGPYETMT